MTTADIPKTCVDAWNTVEGELKSDGDEDELLFLFYTEHADALNPTDGHFKMKTQLIKSVFLLFTFTRRVRRDRFFPSVSLWVVWSVENGNVIVSRSNPCRIQQFDEHIAEET